MNIEKDSVSFKVGSFMVEIHKSFRVQLYVTISKVIHRVILPTGETSIAVKDGAELCKVLAQLPSIPLSQCSFRPMKAEAELPEKGKVVDGRFSLIEVD